MTLFFDILLDDVIGHVPRTDTEVAACPEVSAPELLSQMWELTHQLVGTLPFQHLEQSADRQTRWHAHEQMNVVSRHMPFHDRHFMRAADFADQFTDSCANLTSHHGLTVLRDPDDVQVNAKNSMRAMSVLCHDHRLYHAPENLLKSSPEGEGFNPPRWGQ